MTGRYTLHCAPDELILAARAAKWATTEMKRNSAVLVYGDDADAVTFHVSRTRTWGITVRSAKAAT